ncbi:MAG: cyclic nucleotide-binding domain-containing protein, partial [Candidatus Desulfacyla sp.]
ENPWVSKSALRCLHASDPERGVKPTDLTDEIDPVLRMLHLKKVGIFQGLSVGELAAIGIMCKVVSYGAEEVVIREGEAGDTLYLIFEGDVSVIKGEGLEKFSQIAVMTAGDYFGEMALIDDAPRSATVKTKTKARFMILTKRDFGRIAREHPPIGLNICKALSRRIRDLHGKLGQPEKVSGEGQRSP